MRLSIVKIWKKTTPFYKYGILNGRIDKKSNFKWHSFM